MYQISSLCELSHKDRYISKTVIQNEVYVLTYFPPEPLCSRSGRMRQVRTDCASKIHTVLRIASPDCIYSVVLWTVRLSWDAMDAMDAK